MSHMEMLEKLVENKIGFEINCQPNSQEPPVNWSLYDDDGNFEEYGEVVTFYGAITALYNAAIKAYPERFK